MKRTNGRNRNTLRLRLLPSMAWKGIISNGNVYYPYLAAGAFAVFTYFVFTSILENDIIKILPRSEYAWMMLALGKGLLAVILLLFLTYASGFLVKRRRREFGLYHILGLEKKHIAGMMLFETVLLYVGAVAGGVLFGVVFSKLMFLLLLKICRMPAEVGFVFSPKAFKDTLAYFGVVYAVNYGGSLWEVGKANPIELMSGSRKGEKEPKFLWVYALLGAAALGCGYYVSITSELDEMIFVEFFSSVFFVVVGTYLLFTSGSIAFLKIVKKRKKLYYSPKNFVTVSGMLYRMKKSAAGLSNICIFSTMAIITLVCTVALCIGMEDCLCFEFPHDLTMRYQGEAVSPDAVSRKIESLEKQCDITVERVDIYDKLTLHGCTKAGNSFIPRSESDEYGYADDYTVSVLLLEDYNRVENRDVSLAEDEALVYCNGADFGYDTICFFGREYRVKEEIDQFFPSPKAEKTVFDVYYTIVVRDGQAMRELVAAWCDANGVADVDGFLDSKTQFVQVRLRGTDDGKEAFVNRFGEWGQGQAGFAKLENGVEMRTDRRVMYGALLFIGILFGLVFFMCLILIMYYKQVTEGYEDRDNFGIMQKVGMSDQEIHGTVHRQILLVFGMPLAGALFHTAAGMFMVKGLMAVVSLFDTGLLLWSVAGVSALFVAVYGVSYLVTARTYYRIVRQG